MIEKVAYKPLRSAPRMSVMSSAIGVSYLLQNLSTYVTGGLAQAVIPHCRHIIIIDEDLLLIGLQIIYEKNR